MWWLILATALAGDPDRGAVIAGVAGCESCHTAPDGEPFAGGYVLDTPFGTFVGSNLTPDPTHGLGEWDFADFRRAMLKGRSPKGRPYYPAFPYTAFTGISDADLEDLWAYLQTLEPVARPEAEHELTGLAAWRFLVRFWKIGNFHRRPPETDRGAYLSESVAHCGECHTPRRGRGVLDKRKSLAGTDQPPEPAPNITPSNDGIGDWSVDELASFLKDGMEPDGNVTGGEMRRLVEHGTSLLSDADRHAIAEYILSHPPRNDDGRLAPYMRVERDSKDPMDW